MPIRYAILKAVSSEAQAGPDKVSLEVQETRSREQALRRGWIESSGPYTIPGESRTKYVNLSHAEAAMPELKRMLDDAHDHIFDVLVLYDYDRLRDLLGMVSKTLAHYKVQIFAVNMPVEPIPPAEYNPYKNDMAVMMEAFAMMKQKAQTNDLRRKYQEAMPKRASSRGLPVQLPLGYKRGATSKVPPEPVEEITKHIVHIKDMFLAGKSLLECAEYMTATGIPPKGRVWYRQTIKVLLLNPFYAGLIRWGASRAELDPRTGQTRRNRKVDPDTIIWGEGRHQPLWDEETYDALKLEFSRRGNTYKGKTNQTLSNLLVCDTCGLRMWVFYNNRAKENAALIWRCSSRQEHVSIFHATALDKLAEIIQRDIHAMADEPVPLESAAEQTAKNVLAELKEQRERLVHAYQVGALDLDGLSRGKAPLDQQIAQREMEVREYIRAERTSRDKRVMLETIRANLHALRDFLAGDPPTVNLILRKVFTSVLVKEDGTLEADWK